MTVRRYYGEIVYMIDRIRPNLEHHEGTMADAVSTDDVALLVSNLSSDWQDYFAIKEAGTQLQELGFVGAAGARITSGFEGGLETETVWFDWNPNIDRLKDVQGAQRGVARKVLKKVLDEETVLEGALEPVFGALEQFVASTHKVVVNRQPTGMDRVTLARKQIKKWLKQASKSGQSDPTRLEIAKSYFSQQT